MEHERGDRFKHADRVFEFMGLKTQLGNHILKLISGANAGPVWIVTDDALAEFEKLPVKADPLRLEIGQRLEKDPEYARDLIQLYVLFMEQATPERLGEILKILGEEVPRSWVKTVANMQPQWLQKDTKKDTEHER